MIDDCSFKNGHKGAGLRSPISVDPTTPGPVSPACSPRDAPKETVYPAVVADHPCRHGALFFCRRASERVADGRGWRSAGVRGEIRDSSRQRRVSSPR